MFLFNLTFRYSTHVIKQRLRQENSDFDRFFDEKVCVVEGDVAQDNLGIDKKMYADIAATCDIILSSAASVDFVVLYYTTAELLNYSTTLLYGVCAYLYSTIPL